MTYQKISKVFVFLLLAVFLLTPKGLMTAVAAEENESRLPSQGELSSLPQPEEKEPTPELEPEPKPEIWEQETSESANTQTTSSGETESTTDATEESPSKVWLFVGIGSGVVVLAGFGIGAYFFIRKHRYGY